MRASLDAALAVAAAASPKRQALALSTDQLIDICCALVAHEAALKVGLDLVRALDPVDDATLPPAAAGAITHFAGALVITGYATFEARSNPEENHDGTR
ncbi:hypothetical protein [Azorhizobium sp. AG788]|uniref:hypothetical protein n=1 Tax=Azorhizobium sp. AG788 TaxID=2183897 RepID=UPI0031395C5C